MRDDLIPRDHLSRPDLLAVAGDSVYARFRVVAKVEGAGAVRDLQHPRRWVLAEQAVERLLHRWKSREIIRRCVGAESRVHGYVRRQLRRQRIGVVVRLAEASQGWRGEW